jgi:hypothetical protein
VVLADVLVPADVLVAPDEEALALSRRQLCCPCCLSASVLVQQ